MREYAKVSPQFWIGPTGKKLRAAGLEAQVVGVYLMTCPHANMLGLYYLPKSFIAHETGLPFEGASKGLLGCIDAQFCSYEEASEVVWVFEMAAYQIGEQLQPTDKRCAGVQNEYDSLPENAFLPSYFDRYATAFHLTKKRGESKPHGRGSKAPPKPRAGAGAGERTRAGTGTGDGTGGSGAAVASPAALTPFAAYAGAYEQRYGTEPVRNAKVNALLKKLVELLGTDEAPHVAAFYVGHQNRLYVSAAHAVELLVRDAEKLRMEWATNRQGTQAAAVLADKTQTNFNAFAPLLAAAQAEESHGKH